MSDEHTDLIDYLLGEADPAVREAVERRARADSGFAARLQELAELTGMLSELPADCWPEPELTATRVAGASRRPRRARVLRQRLAAVALAGCLLAAGIAIGALITRSGGQAQRRETVTLRALLPGQGTERAAAQMSDGRMRLAVSHLPVLDANHYYEMWLMNTRTNLVAVASFRVSANGSAELEVPIPVAASRFHFLDISVQDVSEGSSHSADSVLRAPLPS